MKILLFAVLFSCLPVFCFGEEYPINNTCTLIVESGFTIFIPYSTINPLLIGGEGEYRWRYINLYSDTHTNIDSRGNVTLKPGDNKDTTIEMWLTAIDGDTKTKYKVYRDTFGYLRTKPLASCGQ